eukprot:scaffold208654_cov28-Tisochrysis_lutea.AAC.1
MFLLRFPPFCSSLPRASGPPRRPTTSQAALLLSQRADPNVSDRGGNTPIHAAAAAPEAIAPLYETLVRAADDATLSLANREGATPLHLASSKGKLELIRMLVERGRRARE